MKKPLLVFSHDAGGAEVAAALLARMPEAHRSILCVRGPAERIFARRFGRTLRTIEMAELDAFDPAKFDVFLSTSWKSNHERDALARSKELGFRTFSVLDHWTNYRERFIPCDQWEALPPDWIKYLPDEAWVVDQDAQEIAINNGFPKQKLVLKENAYLQDCRKEVESLTLQQQKHPRTCLSLLYVSEPIRDNLVATYGDENRWGFTELDLLKNLSEGIAAVDPEAVRVYFRLHPREEITKYDDFLKSHPSIELSNPAETTLAEDLARVDWVVGGESMGLVMGLACGKRVMSLIPLGAKKPCVLPQKAIERNVVLKEVLPRSLESRANWQI